MSLSRDSRQERKLKIVLRHQFRLRQALERADWEEDVLIKEIEADAGFPKAAVLLLKRSLPRLAAKWLNKAGISSEYQDELACVTAVLLIVQHDRKLSGKLDELISLKRAEEARHAKPETRNDFAGRAGGPAGPYTATPGGSTPPPATRK